MTFTVFIDPGHGPGDGCAGNELVEHEYVYDVAILLAHRVALVSEWQAEISRSDAEDPSHQERDGLARQVGADVVLSLHCDSAPNKFWHGATVFYAGANHRTKAIAHEISRALPAELWSSSQLRGRVVAVPNPVYTDATAVVMRYTPPTVLVEFGFLSNMEDAQYLATRWAKERVAVALAAGVVKTAEYFCKEISDECR